MRLSEINSENLNDEEIQKIVYSGIEDNKKNTICGIIFGNSMLIKERVSTAVDAYKTGRILKVIFCGGNKGISNQSNDIIPEAIRMKELAIKMEIRNQDILINDKTNNRFENIKNAFKLIGKKVDSLVIITSEFHLKRCMAIIWKKFPSIEIIMIPSRDGLSDSDNWFLSGNSWNSGRSLATYEANLLIKYAKENTKK